MKPSRYRLRALNEPATCLILIASILFSQAGCGVRRAPMDHSIPSPNERPGEFGCRNASDLNSPPANTLLTDGYLTDAFEGAFILYKRFLHTAVSRGCPSYPSCSRYMAEAVRRFGFAAGLILGLERLLHETGELNAGRVIMTPEGPKIFDPIENNTFWWKSYELDKISH